MTSPLNLLISIFIVRLILIIIVFKDIIIHISLYLFNFVIT